MSPGPEDRVSGTLLNLVDSTHRTIPQDISNIGAPNRHAKQPMTRE